MKTKTIFAFVILLAGYFATLGTVARGQSSATSETNAAASFPRDVFKTIAQKLPELVCLSATNGTTSSAEVWQGEEYATGCFALSNTPPYPGAFVVTIHRYASVSDAENDASRPLRQEMPGPRESYKGGWLYRFRSGFGNVICQYGPFIVEITPYTQSGNPSTMKVLDVVLNEIVRANFESGRSNYYEQYLADCKTNEIRCLWFLDDAASVGMVMSINLATSTEQDYRDVYNWAFQGGGTQQLSHAQVLSLMELTGKLPPSDTNVELATSVSVSIRTNGNAEVFRYDRRHAPPEVQRIYDLGGAYFYDGKK